MKMKTFCLFLHAFAGICQQVSSSFLNRISNWHFPQVCVCRIYKYILFKSLRFYLQFQFDKCAHGSSGKFAPFHIPILPQIAPPLKLIFIIIFYSLFYYLFIYVYYCYYKFAPFHIPILSQIATPTPLKLIFISTIGTLRRPVTYDKHPSIQSSNLHL